MRASRVDLKNPGLVEKLHGRNLGDREVTRHR
jgi:hypothetical protein